MKPDRISGHRVCHSRRDVLLATADATRLHASSGSDALNSRGRFPPSELPGNHKRLARRVERAQSVVAAGQSGIILLDHQRRLLRLSRPPQLQQHHPGSRRLHRRRGRGWKMRSVSVPLSAIILQGLSTIQQNDIHICVSKESIERKKKKKKRA